MSKIKLLIVEDEAIVAMELQERLEGMGYLIVNVVNSGDKAIQSARKHNPDLILMDIMIKGELSGIETAEEIHTFSDTPVVYLTAYSDVKTIEKAKRTTPYGYLLKPFQERELQTTIETALYKYTIEKKLKLSEAKYHNLFENANLGIFQASPSGKILDANPAFFKMFGYEALENMSNTRLDDSRFFPPESWARFKNELDENRPVNNFETIMSAADGTEITVLINATSFHDHETGEVLYEATVTDITELRKLQEKVIQTQRLEAIGQLSGGIAHEFNNILTSISGYAEMGLMKTAAHDALFEYLLSIIKSSKRASELTRQLLSFSRKQMVQLETVDARTIISDYMPSLHRLVGTDIKLEHLHTGESCGIKADPLQIHEILTTIVENGRDAIRQTKDKSINRKIILETRCIELDELETFKNEVIPSGSYFLISIRDSGMGMTNDVMQKLFEPFFTTKPSKHSGGLSLASAYGITKQNKAYIDAETTPGKGSCFMIYWPILEKQKSGNSSVSENKKESEKTILLIENEINIRMLLSSLFSSLGFHVIVVLDFQEAIDKITESIHDICLTIIDVHNPHEFTPKRVQELKSHSPHMSVLVSSGYSQNWIWPEEEKAEKSWHFIQKPYSLSDMKDKVQQLLVSKT